MTPRRARLAGAALAVWAAAGVALAQPAPSEQARFHPAYARHGMVATQEAAATRVGVDVLEAGGNAVDAAVAVGFALAVTLPKAGNLGGGGFMVVHHAERGETVAIDYRETAPLAASRDMFLDEAGEVDRDRARYSPLAAGVPGTVAGLALALARYGTLTLAEVLRPAIRLAGEGIVVDRVLAADLAARRDRLARWPATAAIFLKPDGTPYRAGERLVQEDLAGSLRRLAEAGPAAFYEGPIAGRIARHMAEHGGLITRRDLARYRALVREPVWGRYRGHRIASMPPPSSGGVHLVQMLNVLEGFPVRFLGHNSADTVHVMTETMKLAYADRSRHLGDPAFWDVPVAGLISEAYAEALRQAIDLRGARPAGEIGPGDPRAYAGAGGTDTTHFSIMDAAGNAVANTYTLNFGFGTGIVVPGTGILLNNEMNDFSAKPGVPNAYGLIGGEANAVEPGKRPLSSMTPTLVFRGDRPYVATGTPGGSRIITTVLQVVMNLLDHDMNLAAAGAAPRFHHQWLPDRLEMEVGFSPDTMALLRARGHRVERSRAMGSVQSVMRSERGFFGASDPREPGALALGH